MNESAHSVWRKLHVFIKLYMISEVYELGKYIYYVEESLDNVCLITCILIISVYCK